MQAVCSSASFFYSDWWICYRAFALCQEHRRNLRQQVIDQVSAICKSAFFNIRSISRIRKFLSVDSAKALVHCYMLYGLPKHLVHRLQLAQNCAARLILCGRKHDHVTPLLKELHWLPVEQRIIFKILLLTFKALNNLYPSYISDLLETYKPTKSLRSSSRNLLAIPRSKLKSHGDRALF